MPLRSIILETRETKKSWNFRKIDLWHVITGSNIDLGPKIIAPIASNRREQSDGLFCESLRRFVWERQGEGVTPTNPLHRRRWQNTVYGRGLSFTGLRAPSCVQWCVSLCPVYHRRLWTLSAAAAGHQTGPSVPAGSLRMEHQRHCGAPTSGTETCSWDGLEMVICKKRLTIDLFNTFTSLTRARPGVWATFARPGGGYPPPQITRKLRTKATSGKGRWIGRGKFYKKYLDHFLIRSNLRSQGVKKVKFSQNQVIFAENRNYLNNYTS